MKKEIQKLFWSLTTGAGLLYLIFYANVSTDAECAFSLLACTCLVHNFKTLLDS